MGKKESIKIIEKFARKLSKDIEIEKIIFFGSRAGGMDREDSDVDLIIVSSSFEGKSFFKRGALMYDYWTEEMPVDFLCYTPKEFELLKKKISIVREALLRGIEILN